MAEFEVFARSVAVNLTPYCRMCMRLATERRLMFADSYRKLITRVLNIRDTAVPSNARICYVCNAMMKRCSRLLDVLLQSQQLAVLMSLKPIDRQNTIILADQEVMATYERHVKSFEFVSKLCITETLNIDSQERDPIDLTDDTPPEPPPYNLAGVLESAKEKLARARTADLLWRRWAARSHDQPRNTSSEPTVVHQPPTSIGNNIVLIPAKSNLVGNNILVQQQPNNSLQLLNQSINNSIQLVNQPNNTIQLLQNVPVLNQVTNNVQVFNRDSSEPLQSADLGSGWQLVQLVDNSQQPTAAAPNVTQLSHVAKAGGGAEKTTTPPGDWESSVERVEDNECIAIIETDISWRSGNSEGTTIVPDLDERASSKLAAALTKPKRAVIKQENTITSRLKPVAIDKLQQPRPQQQPAQLRSALLRSVKPRPPAPKPMKIIYGGKLIGPITSTAPIIDESAEPVRLQGGANLKLVSPASPPPPQQQSQLRITAVTSQDEDARAAEIIDVDGESYRDRGGHGVRPQPKDKDAGVDWEDKIPMEVITYADDVSSPAPQTLHTYTQSHTQSQTQSQTMSHTQKQPEGQKTAYSRQGLKKKLKLV